MTTDPEGPRRLRVLVVDYLTDAADSLAVLMHVWGHECQVAYSSEAALSLYRDGSYDVVVTEIVMPGLSGLEVARSIRSRSGWRPLLVALTGLGSGEYRERA